MAVDCEHIPILNYGEFSKRIHDKVADSRLPIGGSIEITSRCNLFCAHCYISLPADNKDEKEKELSYDEICHIKVPSLFHPYYLQEGLYNSGHKRGCSVMLFQLIRQWEALSQQPYHESFY